MALFSQNVVVNDVDYNVMIIKQDNNYNIVAQGNGQQYQLFPGQYLSSQAQFNRLTSALRNKESMSCKCELSADLSVFTIELMHPLIEINEKYEMVVTSHDTSMVCIFENRIKELENEREITIPITKDMLGPYVEVHSENYMSLSLIDSRIKEFIDYTKKPKTSNASTFNCNLPFTIEEFYTITHHYGDDKPVANERQLVYDGIVLLGSAYKYFPNICTVFKRKYSKDVMGFIKKNSKSINFILKNLTINYNLFPDKTIYHEKENPNTPLVKIPLTSYYKEGYFIKLPFDVSMINNRVYPNRSSLNSVCFVHIQNGCLYTQSSSHSIEGDIYKGNPTYAIDYVSLTF